MWEVTGGWENRNSMNKGRNAQIYTERRAEGATQFQKIRWRARARGAQVFENFSKMGGDLDLDEERTLGGKK